MSYVYGKAKNDPYSCSCLMMLLNGFICSEALHHCTCNLCQAISDFCFPFQHTFSSLLKQKPPKTSPTKPRGNMAVSMRDIDPVFQGAGQKEYPSLASIPLGHIVSYYLCLSFHSNISFIMVTILF